MVLYKQVKYYCFYISFILDLYHTYHTMYEVKETGGAKIGMAHASKPFAVLIINKNKLELNASVIGNLAFRPADIISIMPWSQAFGKGIQIRHSVSNYPGSIVFVTPNPVGLINQIDQTGFLTNRSPIPYDVDFEITTLQQSGRFPIKTSAAIILVLLWNILIISNFYIFFTGDKKGSPIGWGIFGAFGVFILTAVLILISEPFRELILKPGRKIEHVNRFLYFIILLCTIMLVAFSFVPAIPSH